MKNKKKLIATCIEWDTDGEDVDLPNEVCNAQRYFSADTG